MNWANRMLGLVVASCVWAAPALFTEHACAQIRIAMTSGPSGAAEGQVSKRNVDRYVELLGFSPEQKELALTIHDGYAAAYQEAQKARRVAIEDVRRSAEDTGDHTVFMEKMPPIEKDFRAKTAKLNKGFFDDLKGLVSGPTQEARWVKVERMRRRETGMGGGVTGEAVDLIDVVAGLKLSPDAMNAVTPALDEYEAELDHQLQEKAKVASDDAFEPGKIDPEKIQRQIKDAREAGLKVKDVNDRSARKIEPLLPEDKRAAFRDAVKERSFPQVYRPSRSNRDMDAALKFDDLSASQRAAVQELKASYQRDAAALNEAWANAITASEKDGQGGMLVGGDGSRMIMNLGDDPPALANARKARRELDDRTNEKLKGVLTQSQQEKLSKSRASDSDEDVVGGVRTIMIRDDGH
jgi:hypothetical protein